jgi:hypothetical protein
MSYELATDRQMRQCVATAAETFITEDLDLIEQQPPSVARLAIDQHVLLDEPGYRKSLRWAPGAAAAHLLMSAAIEGEGPEARFKQVITDRRSYGTLNGDVISTLEGVGNQLKAEDDRFRFLLERYVELAKNDADAPDNIDELSILQGAALPGNGYMFVVLTSEALQYNKLTNGLDAAGRVAAAHSLVPLVSGKAAVHGDVTPFMEQWADTSNSQLVRRGEQLAIVHPDGRRLFDHTSHSRRAKTRGPLLKCLAHQRIFGLPYSSVENGVHAIVNLAADLGKYD